MKTKNLINVVVAVFCQLLGAASQDAIFNGVSRDTLTHLFDNKIAE
jgi:hypothetical protein